MSTKETHVQKEENIVNYSQKSKREFSLSVYDYNRMQFNSDKYFNLDTYIISNFSQHMSFTGKKIATCPIMNTYIVKPIIQTKTQFASSNL
jgi:hypothetical protein